MFDRRNLRHRANQLLALAQKARDDDYIKLAEYITDRATQLFDEAIILERKLAARGRFDIRATAGDVRCRLLPAEHAAGMRALDDGAQRGRLVPRYMLHGTVPEL